jgi:AAA domain/DnaB-like helicase N terminal domain
MALNAFDPMVEQQLLGAVMLTPEAIEPFLTVAPDHYYQPKNAAIAAVIRDMLARQREITPPTVLIAIQDGGLLPRVGSGTYLFELVQRCITPSCAPQYAERIRELYGRRRLAQEYQRQGQMLDEDWATGGGTHTVAASIATIRTVCDELACYSAAGGCEPPPTLDEFLAGEDTYDWLVPGLLERGDRCILTGGEGAGKSELASQIALCVAGGVHPFLSDLLPPSEARVLIVDCENPPRLHRRRLRRILAAVDSVRIMHGADPVPWSKRLFVAMRPAGINLLETSNETWLMNAISSVGPDLLLLGPVYKLHETTINDGESARRILAVIDRARERHNFALITEAHPGHAKDDRGDRMMRPEGSSYFLRWPEFGFGVRPNKDDPSRRDLVSWRGGREEGRAWPTGLVRGREGLLPWRPDENYLDRPDVGWGRV